MAFDDRVRFLAKGGRRMTFHEKLARLTHDRNKSAICRRAGLTDSAIHNYLSKRQMPGANVALRIAHAIGVEVGWLIDETRAWPPVWLNDAREPMIQTQGAAA